MKLMKKPEVFDVRQIKIQNTTSINKGTVILGIISVSC